MKNLIKTRNWIIVVLCLTIVCMGVGFAVLSMKLENQNNTGSIFAVEFVKAEKRNQVQGGIQPPTITSSITDANQTINIEFNLYSPRDEIRYRITIKNTGNIEAEIINLIEKPDYATDSLAANSILPVKISHNNIVGKILPPGEEIELNIIAMFDYNAPQTSVKIPYQISIIARSKEKWFIQSFFL